MTGKALMCRRLALEFRVRVSIYSSICILPRGRSANLQIHIFPRPLSSADHLISSDQPNQWIVTSTHQPDMWISHTPS